MSDVGFIVLAIVVAVFCLVFPGLLIAAWVQATCSNVQVQCT